MPARSIIQRSGIPRRNTDARACETGIYFHSFRINIQQRLAEMFAYSGKRVAKGRRYHARELTSLKFSDETTVEPAGGSTGARSRACYRLSELMPGISRSRRPRMSLSRHVPLANDVTCRFSRGDATRLSRESGGGASSIPSYRARCISSTFVIAWSLSTSRDLPHGKRGFRGDARVNRIKKKRIRRTILSSRAKFRVFSSSENLNRAQFL